MTLGLNILWDHSGATKQKNKIQTFVPQILGLCVEPHSPANLLGEASLSGSAARVRAREEAGEGGTYYTL